MPTAKQRAALAALERITGRTSAPIAAALLRAIRRILDDTTLAELARVIEQSGADGAVAYLLSDERIVTLSTPARNELLTAAALSGGRALLSVIPATSAAGVFNILDARVIEAVRALDGRVMRPFFTGVQQTIRQSVEAGLVAGINPREMARGIRETVGLAPNMAENVANFRAALESIGSNKDALGYALRDKRFDATLRAVRAAGAKLTPAQIETMVARYTERTVAWHAETVARTAALDANKLGQELAFRQAAEAGLVDEDRLVKRWVTTLDGRERETHAAMNGIEVPYSEPWILPDGLVEMYPGEGEYNCRCAQTYRLLPRRQASAA